MFMWYFNKNISNKDNEKFQTKFDVKVSYSKVKIIQKIIERNSATKLAFFVGI